METAESPLDVLSRAAVMIQRNVLPPPSYDEARSLSQQQKQKLQTRYKTSGLSDDSDDSNAGISSSYDQASSTVSVTNSISGKWKRDKKYQHKTPVTVSACDSTLNGYKIGARFSGRSSSSNLENGSEPLDMSKRSATKNRGEPPSYFQSILNSNYGLRLADLSKSVVAVQEEKSPSTSTTTVTEDKESTMCDQVINEHFRRSLGRDYANVFSANNKSKTSTKKNRTCAAAADSGKTSDDGAAAAANGVADADELDDQSTVSRAHRIDDDDSDVETADTIQNSSASTLSVDDHFAKALGDTWIKLQQQEKRHNRNQNTNHHADDED